jgi:hypothetical protein
MSRGVKNAGDKVGDQIMANADLQVLKDLSVAAGQLYDGAVDSNGEPVDLGLNRDSLPSTNRKYIDAGKVRFAGDKIVVSYEAEITLKQVYKDGISGFQNEMDDMIQRIVDGLKKNYRAQAGKSITLTAEGDGAKVDVEYVSRYRTLVHAVRSYRVAGLSDVVAATGAEVNKREMADSYKKFLEMGGFSRDSNA